MDVKRTKAEMAHYLEALEMNADFYEQDGGEYGCALPEGWAGVEEENPVHPPRQRITLRLDEDVIKWFRAQGCGYQARMNAVLRYYMVSRRSKMLESHGEVALREIMEA